MVRSFTLPQAPLRRAAILAVVVAGSSSCATSIPAPDSTPRASAAPSVLPSPRATAAGAGCDSGAWRAAPIRLTRQVAVPPVPVITAVRTAAHPECGYDRLVLAIKGGAPGYDIRYVTQPAADPSGKAIILPGHSYLLITLRPANAHADSGAATISRRALILSYPMLMGYTLGSDFEGTVTLVVGLQSRTSIRTGDLPGRWYVDIRYGHR